jgi:hypothetical protein
MVAKDHWWGFNLKVDGALATDLALATQERVMDHSEAGIRQMSRSHSLAMGAVVKRYTGRLQDDVAASGVTNARRLSKTWRGMKMPRNKDTMEPAGWFWNKAGTIIDVLTNGAEITVRNRKFLAIPVGPAKTIIRRYLRRVANSSRDSMVGRDIDGRYEGLGGAVAIVARDLGVPELEMRPDAKGFVLVAPGRSLTRTGRARRRSEGDTVLFVLRRRARVRGGRMRGEGLIPELRKTFELDFVAELIKVLPPEFKP